MNHRDDPPMHARLPADIERPDKIVFGLTARQVLILAGTGLALYGVWSAAATVLPPLVCLVAVIPPAAAAFALAVGRRDGISLDAWLLAAIRHRRSPRRLVPTDGEVAPPPPWVRTTGRPAGHEPLPAPLRLPARGVTQHGVIDLGPDGTTALVAASTVTFGLRTASEQNALVTAFGRWLNSLDAPVQILVRAQRADLTTLADRILDQAPGLPHPALEDAARSHAEFLDDLATGRELLHRQVTVAVRGRRGCDDATGRAIDTVRALAACEVAAQVCDGPAAAATLASCLDPTGAPPPPGLAPTTAVIRGDSDRGDR